MLNLFHGDSAEPLEKPKALVKSIKTLICPGCKKPCLQLEQWENDFLAVHKIVKQKVESRYGREPWFMNVFADGCDTQGKLPR